MTSAEAICGREILRAARPHLALLMLALAILLAACGSFYAPGRPNKTGVYLDERTGQPVPEVPEENYGKQWPQKY
jgi:hypothetical protein